MRCTFTTIIKRRDFGKGVTKKLRITKGGNIVIITKQSKGGC